MEALREILMIWIRNVVVERERKGCVWKWNQQHLLMWREREEEFRMTPRFWQEGEGRIVAKQILKGQMKP